MSRTDPTEPLVVARQQLRVARREHVDERTALDQFCKRVERIPVAGEHTTVGPERGSVTIQPDNDRLARVKHAYEMTVLAVPHHLDACDESFPSHLATELGLNVARTVEHTETLTSRVKTTLVEAASTAREQRVDQIGALDDEVATLDRTERLLEDLLDALDANSASGPPPEDSPRLTSCKRRCHAVLDERPGSDEGTVTPESLPAGLYEDTPGVDPVRATLETVLSYLSTQASQT
jgi:hypothetical protein